MVGRLVQQQNIRLFQKQPGEIRPCLFSAGQSGKFLGALLRRDAQAVADFVNLHVHFVAASGLEPVGQIVVLPQLLRCGPHRHGFFQLLHPGLHLHETGISGAEHVLHGVPLREPGNLRNQTQPLVGIDVNLAPVKVHLPGEDVEQGGFPAAVAPENRHPLPFLNLKAQAVQQIFPDDEEFC